MAFASSRQGSRQGRETLAYGELGSDAHRPHHAGYVFGEYGQRRAADHRRGRHLHRRGQQLRHRHADGRGPAGAGHGGDPQPRRRRGRDRRRRQQRQLRRHRHRQLRRRRRQHAHRHLQCGGDGGGDRGADREPDLRQFLGHADREPQPRAQGHRRRRLRRHRTARVYAAGRRRQPAQRRRCWELQRGQLRRPRRRRRSRRRRRGRPRPSRLFPEHRHRHRAGLRRADRCRQSVQRSRFSVSQHAQLRRPRR